MRGRALALLFSLTASVCLADGDRLRVATYNADLSRDGPGLLLGDILKGDDQVIAAADVIARVAPDVLHLTGVDWDLHGQALAAFGALLEARGLTYPFVYAPRPNSGLASGADLDGNGRLMEARDSQGYGEFTGQGGMALLSKVPLGDAQDFSAFLWKDFTGNIAPMSGGGPFPSEAARAVQRLSSVGHWAVQIEPHGRAPITLLLWHGSTPVFDGPEDLNGRRGYDEAMFWLRLMDGQTPFRPPSRPVILMGISNIDPVDGDGRHAAMEALLSDMRLQDPTPKSAGGAAAANTDHAGDPALDTADWSDPEPGNLRVDYVLPDAKLLVLDAGVLWPAPGEALSETVATASRHRLVWVDIALP